MRLAAAVPVASALPVVFIFDADDARVEAWLSVYIVDHYRRSCTDERWMKETKLQNCRLPSLSRRSDHGPDTGSRKNRTVGGRAAGCCETAAAGLFETTAWPSWLSDD
jgi:hypothetical protein